MVQAILILKCFFKLEQKSRVHHSFSEILNSADMKSADWYMSCYIMHWGGGIGDHYTSSSCINQCYMRNSSAFKGKGRIKTIPHNISILEGRCSWKLQIMQLEGSHCRSLLIFLCGKWTFYFPSYSFLLKL